MIEKWIHLNIKFISRLSNWVLPINNIISERIKNGLIVEQEDFSFYKTGLCIAFRMELLDYNSKRLNYCLMKLKSLVEKEHAQNPDCEFIKNVKEGHALTVDMNVIFNILICLDTLFFELTACVEMMVKYTNQILNYFMSEYCLPAFVVINLVSNDNNAEWYKELKIIRNLLIHETASYIAINSSSNPLSLLVVAKDYGPSLDENNCISEEKIDSIINGFNAFAKNLQKEIINIIEGKKINLEFNSLKRYLVREIRSIKSIGPIRLGKELFNSDEFDEAKAYIDGMLHQENKNENNTYAIIDFSEIEKYKKYSAKGKLCFVSDGNYQLKENRALRLFIYLRKLFTIFKYHF